MPDPPDILESAEDGGKDGWVLRGGIPGFSGSDAGRRAIPHHFQRGGGCGSVTLGVSDGGGRGR